MTKRRGLTAIVADWILSRANNKGKRIFVFASLFAKGMEQANRPVSELSELCQSMKLADDESALKMPVLFKDHIWQGEEALVGQVVQSAREHRTESRQDLAAQIMRHIPDTLAYGPKKDFERDFDTLCNVLERNLGPLPR